MSTELDDVIREARLDLRKASGLLTAEEQEEDNQRAAVSKLEGFLLRSLGFSTAMLLELQTAWTTEGAVAILKAESRLYEIRQDADTYLLFSTEGPEQREIARIDGSDKQFGSRVIAAIGDAQPGTER